MSEQKIYKFNVAMTCDGCANSVKRVLSKKSEEKELSIEVEVDLLKKVVTVKTALPEEEILETIKKTNLAVSKLSE